MLETIVGFSFFMVIVTEVKIEPQQGNTYKKHGYGYQIRIFNVSYVTPGRIDCSSGNENFESECARVDSDVAKITRSYMQRTRRQNYQDNVDEKTELLTSQISLLNKRLLQLEIGSASDTNAVIGNILQVLAPKEKSALYLRSVENAPLGEDFDSFSKFNKLRWSSDDQSSILRGDVRLSDDQMGIQVKSEAFYFIFVKVQFRAEHRAEHRKTLPLSYLIYRKRGSIPTYIYEAKHNCVFNDMMQEYSSTSEMILHLNKDDEIFISVDDSDKQFLSTEFGTHTIGLFEI